MSSLEKWDPNYYSILSNIVCGNGTVYVILGVHAAKVILKDKYWFESRKPKITEMSIDEFNAKLDAYDPNFPGRGFCNLGMRKILKVKKKEKEKTQ